MTRPKRKKIAKASPPDSVAPPLNPSRTGMPALDSIIGVKEFRKGNKVYRLIQTNEVDEYERPLKSRRKKR